MLNVDFLKYMWYTKHTESGASMDMNKIDLNQLVQVCLNITPSIILSQEHILNICQDFEEGVTFDYLIIRLRLLNVITYEGSVRVLIWKMISQGLLELTPELKLKY